MKKDFFFFALPFNWPIVLLFSPCCCYSYLYEKELQKHLMYIVTDKAIIEATPDFNDPCCPSRSFGRDIKEILLKSIISIEVNESGNCSPMSLDSVSFITPAISMHNGHPTNRTVWFVSDPHSVRRCIQGIIAQNKSAQKSAHSDLSPVSPPAYEDIKSIRVFVAPHDSPSSFQAVIISLTSDVESYQSLVSGSQQHFPDLKGDLLFVLADVNVPVTTGLCLRENDKLIVSIRN